MSEKQIYENPWLKSLKLTPAEIDVLTCLLENQATKKTAKILSKKDKTVDTQISNIMEKLDIPPPRANLVENVKKFACAEEIRNHYFVLVNKFEFKKRLEKIKQQIKYQGVICKISCQDQLLKEQIESDLRFLDISCFERKKNAQIITVQPNDNYYYTFFEVLYQLIPDPVAKEALTHFETKALETTRQNITEQSFSQESPRSFFLNSGLSLLAFLGITGIFFKLYDHYTLVPVCSNFVLPTADHYLNRPKLINEISEKLKGTHGIQMAVIVGMGGMGKTTLAREYAHMQNFPVVWEINAEKKETLLDSFVQLAEYLSKSAILKAELSQIKQVDNQEEYTKALVKFIQKRLVDLPHWLLIFDNVETVQAIRQFLPINTNLWGNGKILITTQNSNIIENDVNQNKKIIIASELTAREKEELFLRIFGNHKVDKKNLQDFLAVLPSFPLDVAIAANYIVNTGCTLQDYATYLKTNKSSFLLEQREHLENFSSYKNTRYFIISRSCDKIIEKNKELIKLLNVVIVTDSQKIPRNLLVKYAGTECVDQFVNCMRKYSLLNLNRNGKNGSTMISIHRGIQENIVAYLHRNQTKQNMREHCIEIAKTFESYYWPMIERYDISEMRVFRQHLFRGYAQVEPYSRLARGIFGLLIGVTYNTLGDPVSAKPFIDKSSDDLLSEINNTDNRLISKVLTYSGIIEKEHCNFSKAQILLNHSIDLYQKHPQKYQLEIARALRYLSQIYLAIAQFKRAKIAIDKSIAILQRKNQNNLELALAYADLAMYHHQYTGDYKEALHYRSKSFFMLKNICGLHSIKTVFLQRAMGNSYQRAGEYLQAFREYKSSYETFKNYYPDSYFDLARCAISLGFMYGTLGVYKEGKLFLNEGYTILKTKFLADHHIDWLFVLFGKFHLITGQYETARKYLEKALSGYVKNFGHDHYRTSWIMHSLGLVYGHLGLYQKADYCFARSLSCYEKKYGQDHIDYVLALNDFGEYLILKNDLEEAEICLKKVLLILRKTQHAEIYRCLECLGDLYLKKNLLMEKRGVHSKQPEKQRAYQYFQEALMLAQKNFPPHSAHIVRLKSKI